MHALELATYGFVALLGLFVGSFLNVVIYRLPRACMSVWRQTRSRCPRCSVQLRWFDNIPVFSWLVLLRGRCFRCGTRISMRYPSIEIFTSAVFLGLFVVDLRAAGLDEVARAGAEVWGPFVVQAIVASALIAASVIDLDFRILPDAITLPGIALAPLAVFLVPEVMPPLFWTPSAGALGEWGPRLDAMANAIAGAALGGGLLWGIGWLASKAFRKPAMGLGDVKLFAAMGGFLGAWLFLALILACFAGAIVGVALLARRKDRYVPFGPFLALGMMLTLLSGPAIIEELEELLIIR